MTYKLNSTVYKKIFQLLSADKNILITTHFNPDGDAIGAVLGLYLFLKEIGLKTHVITPNEFPEFLHWMPGSNEILIFSENEKKVVRLIGEADIIFMCDYNDFERLEGMGKYLKESKANKILIDHHPDPEINTKFKIFNVNSSSTAELVLEFILHSPLAEKLNKNISTCLYAGIMTDTVDFKHNIHSRTFELISQLIKKGINPEKINDNVYDYFSFNRMKLLGHALNKKMKVLPQYHTGYIYLSRKDLEEYSYQVGDSESFVNYPLSVKGITFSAFFIEKEDHIKISFRSKGKFEVNKFSASFFQGGGHKNAAGGKSFESLDKTIKRFEKLVRNQKSSLTA